jgi:hypothetical protein
MLIYLEICGSCLSFPKIKEEALYCARGKSKSEIEHQGCICPGCEVYEKYDLSGTYFCAERKSE